MGELSAQFLGAGDDRLEVQLRFITTELVEIFPGDFAFVRTGFTSTPAPLSARLVQADGGSGFDSCRFLGPLQVLGCEVVTPLAP